MPVTTIAAQVSSNSSITQATGQYALPSSPIASYPE